MAFCCPGQNQPVCFYLSTHLSHVEVVKLTTHSQESGLRWERLPQSTLQKQMLRNQRRFDRKHELGGLSLMKTWGLASLEGYIAACITLHPGDMAEYFIPSNERAIIVFSAHGLKDCSANLESFSWDIDPEVKDGIETLISILDVTFEYEQLQQAFQSKTDKRIIYAAVIASMLVWDKARMKRLLTAEHALVRLASLIEVDLTPEIDCLGFLIKQSPDAKKTRAKIKEAAGFRSKEALSLPYMQDLLDVCSFCAQALSWESLTEASCPSGHQFGGIAYAVLDWIILLTTILVRCSLTFLAIKEPGVCKYCEICDRAYYNEHLFEDCYRKRNTQSNGIHGDSVESSIPNVEEVADTEIFDVNLRRINSTGGTSNAVLDLECSKSTPLSLTAFLFDTFDICPYCGGKFID